MKKWISLYKYLVKTNGILDCPGCKKQLFKVDMPADEHAAKETAIQAKHFHPITPDVPQPIANQKAECPFCRHALWGFFMGGAAREVEE